MAGRKRAGEGTSAHPFRREFDSLALKWLERGGGRGRLSRDAAAEEGMRMAWRESAGWTTQ